MNWQSFHPNSSGTRTTITSMILASAFTASGIFLGLGFAWWTSVPSNNQPAPMILRADTAAGGKNVSLATGSVDGTVDGLFVLDHLTGKIECWVLNVRTGAVAARYVADVTQELGVQKSGDADYVLTTGRFVYEGGVQVNDRPGRAICYVADGNSGLIVGYGLKFNRQTMLQGDVQESPMLVVCRGNIRGEMVQRDQ